MLPYFRHALDTSIFRDHRAIRPYHLQRSHLLIELHKSIVEEIEKSRRTLDQMNDLENEAAKQLYMIPIPSTLLSLFHDQLLNLQEHTLKERITTSGRCEFSITFLGMVMILFIEFKDSLKGSSSKHSNVAQILAEADGADLFNQIHESNEITIHTILTDGQAFEFFVVNFYDWKMMRDIRNPIEGVP